MKRLVAVFLLGMGFSIPAVAALAPGAIAPDFTAPATLGGQEFTFSLAEALKKGPVVLYFYPAAFTKGCTIEAHEFADAAPQFQALGATVIGVSRDTIETLNKFSVEECRSAFPVAADTTGDITQSYDAVLPSKPTLADRTSYVIVPGGTILYAYHDMDPYQHVGNTLNAVATWVDEQNAAQ